MHVFILVLKYREYISIKWKHCDKYYSFGIRFRILQDMINGNFHMLTYLIGSFYFWSKLLKNYKIFQILIEND